MKIIILADAWGAKYGGINTFNYEFCKAVSKYSQNEVICVLPYLNSSDAERSNNLLLIGLYENEDKDFLEGWDLVLEKKLKSISINIEDIEFVIGHDIITGNQAINFANGFSNMRSIIFNHQAYELYESYKNKSGNPALDKGLQQINLFKQSDLICCVGPLLFEHFKGKHELAKHNEEGRIIEFIPGLNIEEPSKAKPSSFSLLTLGRFFKEHDLKGVDLTANAFALAVKESRVTFGERPELNTLGIYDEVHAKDIIQETAQKADKFIVINPASYTLKRSELFSHILNSSCVTMLSMQEGFGLVGWEAISCQVPVFISQNSGLYKLLLKNRLDHLVTSIDLLNNKSDVGSVKEKLKDIAANLEKKRIDSEELLNKLREKYNWENIIHTFFNAIIQDDKCKKTDDNSNKKSSSNDKSNINKPNNISNTTSQFISDRIDFLEANILDGFKLKKNYMGVIIPRIGDRYTIYVYKEFSLLKPKDSIKCRIHINNKQKIKNPSLAKEDLKLKAFISINNGVFSECRKIDEISVGEEYLQFKAYLKQDNHDKDITISKGNSLTIFYTYEVYCAHYGNELVRKTSVFPDSELVCELVYPKDDERYEFGFYERPNEDRKDLQTLNMERFTVKSNKSILFQIQSDSYLNKILNLVFPKDSFEYKQVNYKEMLKANGKPLQQIYDFVVEWNSTPFLADPEMFLVMERYINDGSPSGFTKIHAPSQEYTPYLGKKEFAVNTISIKGNFTDYGTAPEWLNHNEVIIHPEYNQIFSEQISKEIIVEPTASARTLYLKDKQCYAKLQYNKEIGRLIRSFTPEKIKKATHISSYLKECFDSGLFSKDLYFLPENFGRIIDLESENHPFGSKYLGMIIRDYIPYPNRDFEDSEWRLIPAFSLFAKEYKNTAYVTKSILELLYDYRKETLITYEDFILDNILKPVFKLYFELLIKAGLHIEGHAQNILFLIKIDKNKVDFLGAVIRDFESIDIDMAFIKINESSDIWTDIATSFSRKNSLENYQKRNSFLFDFKLGEYLISPILNHSKDIMPEFDSSYVINTIKDFNRKYLSKLESDFYPSKKWYSYKKVAIDRSTEIRPWVENMEMPKYR